MNQSVRIIASAVALAFLSSSLFAETKTKSSVPQKPASQKAAQPKPIEQSESIQEALDSLAGLKASFEEHSKKKYEDCMKAFGSESFCACVRDKSPVGIDFGGYVHVVTSTNAELKYDSMDNENKDLIDKTRQVREACVQQGSGAPK